MTYNEILHLAGAYLLANLDDASVLLLDDTGPSEADVRAVFAAIGVDLSDVTAFPTLRPTNTPRQPRKKQPS